MNKQQVGKNQATVVQVMLSAWFNKPNLLKIFLDCLITALVHVNEWGHSLNGYSGLSFILGGMFWKITHNICKGVNYIYYNSYRYFLCTL